MYTKKYSQFMSFARSLVKPKKSNLLETLVSQINSDNLHKEIDTGKSIGHEEW